MAWDIDNLLDRKDTVSALTQHYESAVRRILSQLAVGVSRPGAARARDLLRELNRIIDDLDPRRSSYVRRWIRRVLPQAYVVGSREATWALRRDLERAAAAGSGSKEPPWEPSSGWTAVDHTAIAAIVSAADNQLHSVAAQIRTTLGVFVRRTQVTLLQSQAIRDATTGGIIRGATSREVADEIAAALLGKKLSPQVKRRLLAEGFRGDMFEQFERVARGELITVGKKTMSVRDYADLVARTQMREMAKVASVVRCQKNGVDHMRVSKHVMPKPDECTPWAGQVFYIGPLPKDAQGFPSLRTIPNGGPPFHPFCVLPGSKIRLMSGEKPIEDVQVGDLVLTHRGRYRRVTSVMRREYSGALFDVNGVRLSPEHPVLTNYGWIAAGDLCGLQETILESRRRASARRAYFQHSPSVANQSAVSKSLPDTTQRSAVALLLDFDGDPGVRESEIDGVYPDLVLVDRVQSPGAQKFKRVPLPSSCRFPVMRNRVAGHLLPDKPVLTRIAQQHATLVLQERIGLFVGHAPLFVATGSRPRLDSMSPEKPHHRMPGVYVVPEFHGKLLDRGPGLIPTFEVIADRLADLLRKRALDFAPAHLLTALERAHLLVDRSFLADWAYCQHDIMLATIHGAVKPVIDKADYSGALYNFSVDEDESYLAEGVVVHNCRHVLVPYVVDLKPEAKVEEARELVAKIPRRFYGKGASEVRKMVGELTQEEIDGMFPESSKSTVAPKVPNDA